MSLKISCYLVSDQFSEIVLRRKFSAIEYDAVETSTKSSHNTTELETNVQTGVIDISDYVEEIVNPFKEYGEIGNFLAKVNNELKKGVLDTSLVFWTAEGLSFKYPDILRHFKQKDHTVIPALMSKKLVVIDPDSKTCIKIIILDGSTCQVVVFRSVVADKFDTSNIPLPLSKRTRKNPEFNAAEKTDNSTVNDHAESEKTANTLSRFTSKIRMNIESGQFDSKFQLRDDNILFPYPDIINWYIGIDSRLSKKDIDEACTLDNNYLIKRSKTSWIELDGKQFPGLYSALQTLNQDE